MGTTDIPPRGLGSVGSPPSNLPKSAHLAVHGRFVSQRDSKAAWLQDREREGAHQQGKESPQKALAVRLTFAPFRESIYMGAKNHGVREAKKLCERVLLLAYS